MNRLTALLTLFITLWICQGAPSGPGLITADALQMISGITVGALLAAVAVRIFIFGLQSGLTNRKR